tara:strand:+ start:512 stop:937 length:426 start_codon:yes stop_codon:yes gene_type:complete
MNSILLIILGIPIVEITVMIKVGQKIGALNTVSIIFLTAIIGIYFARIEGLNTIRAGILNIYQNKTPIYEMISGASIAFAALLLIIPGFITDAIGFVILIPFTRKLIINFWIKNKIKPKKDNEEIIDAEIVEDKKIDKDEL